MIGIRPAEEHPNLLYLDKVSVANNVADWGPPPVVKLRSRGSFKHACWIGSVDGEPILIHGHLRQTIRARSRELVNQVEDWCRDNLRETYTLQQMNGAWSLRLMLMNEMDAFCVKMRWGGEQFAHVEFRDPETIAPRKRAGTGIIA
jgi:hypothetical protein